ncbi:hypothetical protein EDD16DRAFT_1446124, partial [Pisolithus croceorrhizus]
ILRTCDAVVSGSTALHILLPELGTGWTPADMDVYIPQRTSALMLRRLKVEGYTPVAEKVQHTHGYRYSDVLRVLVVSNGYCKIDVVVSRTPAAISPIFQFHSTALMNFISADTIFCCYPKLTLHYVSMANA